MIEILSQSTADRDRGAKAKLYARFGVDHYWIVDPAERTLEAFSREDAAFGPASVHRHDATARLAPFPGLLVDLREVWPA